MAKSGNFTTQSSNLCRPKILSPRPKSSRCAHHEFFYINSPDEPRSSRRSPWPGLDAGQLARRETIAETVPAILILGNYHFNKIRRFGGFEMGRQAVVLYVVAMVAVIVGVDLVFFRNRFWERLIVNIGIVLAFATFYLRFLRRP